MPVELVTIPGVPILRTGSYSLGSGDRVFAEEDLRAAADAFATDPAVKAPRIKIDSLEQALGLDPAAHGGEPAFGWADNLTVTANGQELLADVHVPAWLAEAMTWAYPSLSIEGTPPGWTSASGRSHELVVTAVALLGTHWPGVTTLDDFREILAAGPAPMDEPDEAGVLATLRQRPRDVAASLDSDLVARRFYDGLDTGSIDTPEGCSAYDLWIRSMRFDDNGRPYLKVTDEDSGTLYRVDFTVKGAEVTFGSFGEVVEQDVPVTAGAALPAAPLASWGTRELSRAVTATNHTEASSLMTDEQRRALALSLGLPEDTAEDRLHEVAAERAATDPPETPPAETDPEGAAAPEPVAARAAVPEGMRLVDESTWETTRQGAQAGADVAARIAREDRDRAIRAAIGEGRFPGSRREHYEAMWERDPEGTRVLLTASAADGGLAPGLVPVGPELGAGGDGETSTSAEAEHDAYMQRHFPQAHARLASRGEGRVRTRTEV